MITKGIGFNATAVLLKIRENKKTLLEEGLLNQHVAVYRDFNRTTVIDPKEIRTLSVSFEIGQLKMIFFYR